MVHCYQNNGYHIIMDVESGAVHVADEVLYQLVEVLEPLFEGEPEK